MVEVAAGLSRALDDAAQALLLAQALRGLSQHAWLPLDDSLADEAARLGATHRLRGADAIYAAVASRHQATLVTLDTQQLQRLKPVIAVMNPVDMLHNLMSSSS